MRDVPTRMTRLYTLLTGRPQPPRWHATYPPAHLWGEAGAPKDEIRERPRPISGAAISAAVRTGR